ncbi:hypothetical protein CSKR_107535, partial [Clonorchis sinensis]
VQFPRQAMERCITVAGSSVSPNFPDIGAFQRLQTPANMSQSDYYLKEDGFLELLSRRMLKSSLSEIPQKLAEYSPTAITDFVLIGAHVVSRVRYVPIVANRKLVTHYRGHDNENVGTNVVAQWACANCSRLFPTKISLSQHHRHAHLTQHNAEKLDRVKYSGA